MNHPTLETYGGCRSQGSFLVSVILDWVFPGATPKIRIYVKVIAGGVIMKTGRAVGQWGPIGKEAELEGRTWPHSCGEDEKTLWLYLRAFMHDQETGELESLFLCSSDTGKGSCHCRSLNSQAVLVLCVCKLRVLASWGSSSQKEVQSLAAGSESTLVDIGQRNCRGLRGFRRSTKTVFQRVIMVDDKQIKN